MNNFVTAAVDPHLTGIPQIAKQLESTDANARRRAEKAAQEESALRKHISPKETPPVPMPKLLNERRHQYLIPDEAFEYAAMFDRVLVWQVSRFEGETYGNSLIVMPDSTKENERNRACLGIVVAAGLRALDEIRSHGADLGHLVAHARNVIFRLPFATIGGKDCHLIVLTAGDIIASCDLALMRKEKQVRIIEKTQEDGSIEHLHCDENGKLWHPQTAFMES
jgi:hypothetical protein